MLQYALCFGRVGSRQRLENGFRALLISSTLPLFVEVRTIEESFESLLSFSSLRGGPRSAVLLPDVIVGPWAL